MVTRSSQPSHLNLGTGTRDARSLCSSNTPPNGVSPRILLKPKPARALTSMTGNDDGSRIKKSDSCCRTTTTRRAKSACLTRSHLVRIICIGGRSLFFAFYAMLRI